MKYIIPLCIFASILYANEPDWVSNYGQSAKYPQNLYLTGFATSLAKDKDALEIAEENARANLARNLIVNIKSVVIDRLEEKDNKSAQFFQSVTQSSTDIRLQGVKTEFYRKDRLIYALAFISRIDLARIYDAERNKLVKDIRQWTTSAEKDEQSSKTDDAAEKYMKTYALYDELTRVNAILAAAGSDKSAAFSTFADILSKEEISLRVNKLKAHAVNSVDDAARAIVYQISKQTGISRLPVMIVPMTYQETKMASSFSKYFQQSLETHFLNLSVGQVVRQSPDASPRSSMITRDIAVKSGASRIFEGNYWDLGDKIKIVGRLKDLETGVFLAAAEINLDTALIVLQKIHHRPENYLKMLSDQKAFAEDEVISGNIQLDVWTNKGNENLLFVEDDIMIIYIRVNRAVHIRILYNTADGQRALLLNDYYIDESKANMVVEIPQEFQCAPPFGSEMMVVVARTEPFPKLATVNEGGYEFVVDNNVRQLAAGIRGMVKVQRKSQKIQQTEARIILTTVAK